jgi:hypothetical protein
VPQALHCPLVGLGHHPEEPGACAEHRVGNGEVGGQRHRCVVVLRRQARAEDELVAIASHVFDLLLRRLDRAGAASDCCRLHAAGELIEVGGQVGSGDRVVGQLRAAADDGSLGPIQSRCTIAGDPHVEHHRRAGAVGQQAGCTFRQRRRVQPRLSIGKVQRGTALPCLVVERVAGLHEPGDIGDCVVQQQVVAAALDGERLVEVGAGCRVERDERPVGAIRVLGRRASGRRFRGRHHLRRELRWN